MVVLCGCYRSSPATNLLGMTPDYLPLLDSEAHTTILSATSKTVLKQTFSNGSASEEIKECIYTFPLYDGVSVVGFTCQVGSRIIRGVVKEKAKAQDIFDAAVARGETAGLLTQAIETADVFSTKLGNIPARAKIIVEITYIGELKHDDVDGIRFTIPTSIAPRYGSGPSPSKGLFGSTSSGGLFGSSSNHLEGGSTGQISITVDINLPEGLTVKGLKSPSHPIAVSMGTLSTAAQANPVMNKASATLSLGSSALERDFVLILTSKGTGIPKALLETHPTIPNHRALMATLVPRFNLPPTHSEIVFVADRSGSMQDNIDMLISALKVFLKSMPTGIKFNICSFGTNYTFLWKKSKNYNSDTVNEAIKHISTFGANFGGTETFKAIKATVDNRLGDVPLEITLLTDGDIWNQQPLFTYVNEEVVKSQGNIRVFPLGIGIGVSHTLIEGLARAGNGFAQSVQHGERFDNAVVRMLRGALSPHITDYTLELKYDQDDDDFEVIEKVSDGTKNLVDNDSGSKTLQDATEPVGSGTKLRLADRGLMQSKQANQSPEKTAEQTPQATISLYDPNINPNTNIPGVLGGVIDLPNLRHPKLLQAPHKIPSLIPYSRTTVYLLMGPETIQRNPTAAILRATSSHGPLAVEIPIEVLSEKDQTIHQLAARKASQDLEESRGWVFDGEVSDGVLIKDKYPGQFEALIQKEAVRLGETFQVANKWCSFVAVSSNDGDIEMEIPNANSKVAIPRDLPYYPPSSDRRSDTRSYMPPQMRQSSVPQQSYPSNALFQSTYDPCIEAPPTSEYGSFFGSSNNPSRKERSTSGVVRESMAMRSAGGGYGGGYGGFPQRSYQPPQSQPSPPAKPGMMGQLFRSMRGTNTPDPVAASYPSAPCPPPPGAMAPSFKKSATSPESYEPPIKTNEPSIKTNTDKVLRLIEWQSFDGSWDPKDTRLREVLGFEIPNAPQGVDKKIWLTMLVIVFLETKMVDEEGMWGLVVDKARGYVQTAIPDRVGELEQAATPVVNGGK